MNETCCHLLLPWLALAALAQSLHHLALLLIHLLYLLLCEEFAELLIVFVPDVEYLLAPLETLAGI